VAEWVETDSFSFQPSLAWSGGGWRCEMGGGVGQEKGSAGGAGEGKECGANWGGGGTDGAVVFFPASSQAVWGEGAMVGASSG
jgi:hypothetical protein